MGALGPDGPFRPGTGAPPPYLAGREREKRLFRGLLGELVGGAPPASEVILHGPRGNGKTVLLRWLRREARSRSGLEVLARTPSDIADRIRLAEELLPETWWRRYGPDEVVVAGISWRPGKGRPPSPRAVLDSLWIKRPAWESVLEEMGNPIVRAAAGRFPHRMAARIACAIRSAVFRGEGGPSPHPSPAALRAASAHEGLFHSLSRPAPGRRRSCCCSTRRTPWIPEWDANC